MIGVVTGPYWAQYGAYGPTLTVKPFRIFMGLKFKSFLTESKPPCENLGFGILYKLMCEEPCHMVSHAVKIPSDGFTAMSSWTGPDMTKIRTFGRI